MDTPPKFLQEKYDNVEFIAQGDYGRVYKCARAEAITAVKILDAFDSESQERFKTEIKILQHIDHINIVNLLDAGETDGYYWHESEYANQGHFGQMQGYLLSTNNLDVVDYFRQICIGVKALHDLEPSIIHHDLKPTNILVFEYLPPKQHTVLKIADFGLATIAGTIATGNVVGANVYRAPEVIKTLQSDIYSLGITFLEARTGHTTPNQENLNSVPELLRPIIQMMVQQHPRDRYQSISEVLEAFDGLSSFQLFTGREPQENKGITPTFHFTYQVDIGRELENALEFLYTCNSDNVFERWTALERMLDRLGDAHDHKAHILMNMPRNAIAMIDKVNYEKLLGIVRRFMKAAELTKDSDFYRPAPRSWSCFLAETFALLWHPPTKHLCLEGLANFLVRFRSPGTKDYLYITIKNIGDPSYMEHLAVCLREVGREDIAGLLDGVPDQRPINFEALESTLYNAE